MRDLHIVTVSEDGARILLADESGEQFSVAVDERLRASMRGETVREGQMAIAMATPLSPRDIQSRVRAGATAEEVAEHAGVPLERVLRFAAPVLDERAHMARRARTVLLRNESMLELGTLDDVVTAALKARDLADTISWDAWRRDDDRWIVACRWVDEHEEHTALWVLDASAGSATPMDDDALALAGLQPSRAPSHEPATGPRLAVVPDTRHDTESETTTVEEDDTPTGPIPPLGRDDAPPRSPGPAHPARRQRRATPVSHEAPLPLAGLGVEADQAPAAPPPSRPARDAAGHPRPAVPSWDEIMFGRRT
jgi:hypothetical protein